MGIGTASGHALAEQLMAAAVLARAKGAELAHRMRTEAQESAPHTNAPTNSTANTGHPKPDAPTGDNSKNTEKKIRHQAEQAERHRRHDRRRR